MFGKTEKVEKKENIDSTVGIDIGTYAIKLLQVRKDADQIHLETYGELEMAAYDSLPPGSISEIGEEKMVTAIRDLFIASKVSADRVVFSIPMQDCFVSTIEIPKVSDKELNSLLPIEARKYLPVPISEVKLNFWRTEVNNRVEDNKDTIVIAAVKNETYNLFNRYAQKLGIKDFSFEIESLSLARIVLKNIKKDESVLCVDIGGKNSFVSLLDKGILKSVNIIQKGSYENTLQISKILSVSIDVAEEAKRIFGFLGDDSSPHLAEVMGLASYPLFDEIKHLLLGYERKYNINIEKIVLSGGGALQKGIKDILSEFLKREVIFVDSFSGLVMPNKLKDLLKDGNEKYAIASGLALKNYFS